MNNNTIMAAFAVPKITDPNKIRVLLHAHDHLTHAPLPKLFCIRDGADWREYADGTIIQWGEGAGINQTVNFPRPFLKICWHVSVNILVMPADRLIMRCATNINDSSFLCLGHYLPLDGASGGQAGEAFSWMAWGM